MGVASEVFEDSLRASKRRLAINHPLDPPEERCQVEESGGFPQGLDLSGEAEKIFPESGFERFEEEPPEQAGEYLDRQKEAGLRGNPAGSVKADASSGRNAVDMRMKQQILPPLTANADVPQALSPDKLTGASAPVVRRTEKKPMRAPRCRGSAAIVCRVEALAANRILYRRGLLRRTRSLSCSGIVKTTW
jgi:hypothetical protein